MGGGKTDRVGARGLGWVLGVLAAGIMGFGCGDDSDAGSHADASAPADASPGDAAPGDGDGAAADAAVDPACAELDCEAPARCQRASNGTLRCVCPSGYSDENGDGSVCEDKDECAAATHDCDADPEASCENVDGGFECTCPLGYEGDGHGDDGCTDRDECADPDFNDCLSEEQCTNSPGGHSCGCDLVGTFASMVALQVQSDEVSLGANVIASASMVTLETFELRRVTAQDDGSITVEVTPCGGTSAELCSPFYMEAWSQDLARSLWSKLGTASASIPLASTRVGDPFITEDAAVFLGVSLPASYSAAPWPWPSAHDDPDLTWLDPDGDGAPGASSIVRHTFRNDLWMTDSRFVQGDFDVVPASSPVCGDPYGYWVNTDGTRVREFHLGSRSVSRFVGQISSCDLIEGELRGPGPNNTPIADTRIGGCVSDTGVACTAAQVSAYDDVPNPSHVNAGCFQQVRVPDSFSCADVLAYGFSLLVGPNADQCP